jgi:hypothetical protein
LTIDECSIDAGEPACDVSLTARFHRVSAVAGIGLGKRPPNAARRSAFGAIAVAAALLAAPFAEAPAGADVVPSTGDSPPVSYEEGGGGGTTAPPTYTAQQGNTATSTQTATATGGAGGTATGGNAAGSGSHGGNAYANGGDAEAHNSLDSKQSNQVSGRDSSNYSGKGGNNGSGDVFVLDRSKSRSASGTSPRTKHTRSPGHFGLSTARRVTKTAAKESSGNQTGKATPDVGLPGHGPRLPDQNPFFSLLNTPGGTGTGLMLLLLAVLGAAIALPNERSKAFRTPTLLWRPLAYVPPIKLPG